MAVVIPNDQDTPSFIAMAVRDRTDDFAARCDSLGTGVISGMAVTQNTGTGTDMTYNVASGVVAVGGTQHTYAGGSGLGPIGAASTGDRRDTVVYRNGTGIVVVPGSAPAGLTGAWTTSSTTLPPVKANIVESTDVVLAEVYVAFNTTVIVTATNIVDKRNVLGADPLALQVSNNLSDVATRGTARLNIRVPTLASVQAAATTNVSIAAPGATMDGFSFVSSGLDTFLLTGQSTSSQNGTWVWNGAASPATRPTDFASGAVLTTGRNVSVQNGTVYGGSNWLLAVPSAGLTIDTTAQVWTAQNIIWTSANETAMRSSTSPDQLLTMQANLPFGGFKGTGAGLATATGDTAVFQQLPSATTFTGALTTVAAGSNGVNLNTFGGAGVLNVTSNAGASTTGYLVVNAGGNAATVSYTGLGTNTFTGCTTLFGSGVLSSTAPANQVAYGVNFTPTVSGPYEITTVGGGGGGGSGGSPATSATNQSGGGGGGAGMTSLNIQQLIGGTTYTVTVGYGGNGGAATAGGAAGAGNGGVNGSASYFNGVNVTSANGGGSGSGAGATSAAAVGGGGWGGAAGTNAALTFVGAGGGSSTFSGISTAGLGQALLAAGGGGGGGTATATNGGSGGAAGAFGTSALAGTAGGSGSHAGLAGSDAAGGSGGGGGGGGGACGAATIGASGKGGQGGSGLVIIIGPLV